GRAPYRWMRKLERLVRQQETGEGVSEQGEGEDQLDEHEVDAVGRQSRDDAGTRSLARGDESGGRNGGGHCPSTSRLRGSRRNSILSTIRSTNESTPMAWVRPASTTSLPTVAVDSRTMPARSIDSSSRRVSVAMSIRETISSSGSRTTMASASSGARRRTHSLISSSFRACSAP